MQIKFALAALSMVACGTPALADPQQNAASTMAQPKAKSQEPVYCIKYEGEVGSHLARQQCKTKKQWAALDVNVEALTKD